jgi:hypothetical protein
MKPGVLLLAALLSACAQAPSADSNMPLSPSEARARYEQGVANYRRDYFVTAFGELNAALASSRLDAAETIDTRKHLAFLHCIAEREAQCREQFQAILDVDPDFELSANEANYPSWGQAWRAVKGALEDRRALERAARMEATPAQQKLAEGIREYEVGRYKESLQALQEALKAGLPARTDAMRARKYTAFIHCLSKQEEQCRTAFKEIFRRFRRFELLPSEAANPAWAAIYSSEKEAAAGKRASPKKAG